MLDRLALVSDSILYFVCDPNFRVIYSNNFFQSTIDITIGANLLDFLHEEDAANFLKVVSKKKNNVSVKVKVKGHRYELCRFTFDTLLHTHLHFIGVILEDTPQTNRDEIKRQKKALESIKHFIHHELLSHHSKVEGGLKLLGMAKTDLERNEAILIIENASAALRLAIMNANTKI